MVRVSVIGCQTRDCAGEKSLPKEIQRWQARDRETSQGRRLKVIVAHARLSRCDTNYALWLLNVSGRSSNSVRLGTS